MTIKTAKIHEVYLLLSKARYTKLTSEEKKQTLRLALALRPIADKYAGDTQLLQEKLKPSEDIFDRFQEYQQTLLMIQHPKADLSRLPMGLSETRAFKEEWDQYNKLLEEEMKNLDEDVELDVAPLSADAITHLMDSNEWTFDQVVLLSEAIGE